jgi:hypothetical protein
MGGICSDDIRYCMRDKNPDLDAVCSVCRHFGRLAGILDEPDGCPKTTVDPPTGEGWQLWETVSEGSPITPVYSTAEGLIDHMCSGPMVDLPWDTGWSRKVAEAFVRGDGWAPSMVVIGGTPFDGVTAIVDIEGGES